MGRLGLILICKPKGIELPHSKVELRVVLQKHDASGDGKLSWEEVKAAYKELGSRCSWLATENGFRHADHNEDQYFDMETELEHLVAYSTRFVIDN